MSGIRSCFLILCALALMFAPCGASRAEPSSCPYDPHLSIMYSCLTEPEWLLYDRMYDALRAGGQSVSVPAGVTLEEAEWMTDYIYNEAPELCAYDRWNTAVLSSSGRPVSIRLAYKLPLSAQNRFIEETKQLARQFAGKSGRDGVKAIHDYLIRRFEYGSVNGEDTQLAYFALKNNKAVCNGYAQTAAMLCHFAGYSCSYIDGHVYDSAGKLSGAHAWNVALSGPAFFWFDATWDDGGLSAGTDWFFLSGRDMAKTHRPDPEYSPIVSLDSMFPGGVSHTMYLDLYKNRNYVRGAAEGQNVRVKLAGLAPGEYYSPALVIWNQGSRPFRVTVRYSLDGQPGGWGEAAVQPGSNLAFRIDEPGLKGKAGKHTVTWYVDGLRLDTFVWDVN